MPNLFTLTLYVFAVLMLMYTLGFTYFNDIEGQLAVPDITQRVEQPNSPAEDSTKPSPPEEQMAMQALFSPTGQLYGFGLNVNNGSLLCPSNNCEYTVEKGVLRQDNEERYILEGNLQAAEEGTDKSNARMYTFDADLGVKGTKEQGSNITKIITGFLDVHSDTNFNYVHYYI